MTREHIGGGNDDEGDEDEGRVADGDGVVQDAGLAVPSVEDEGGDTEAQPDGPHGNGGTGKPPATIENSLMMLRVDVPQEAMDRVGADVPEMVRPLLALYALGHSVQAISASLGVRDDEVQGVVSRWGGHITGRVRDEDRREHVARLMENRLADGLMMLTPKRMKKMKRLELVGAIKAISAAMKCMQGRQVGKTPSQKDMGTALGELARHMGQYKGLTGGTKSLGEHNEQ